MRVLAEFIGMPVVIGIVVVGAYHVIKGLLTRRVVYVPVKDETPPDSKSS